MVERLYPLTMDVIDLDRRAAAAMAEILAATTPEHYPRPTPCPGWTVGDLVVHVVAGNVKYTQIAQGGEWARGVPEVELGDDPIAMYLQTVETMLEAWRQPGVLERAIDLPRGRGRAEAALYVHLGETLVHGWDVAVSTGERPGFDEDVVEASLAQYTSWLPPSRPSEAPFSDATMVPGDAPPIDRLAAYLGRDVRAWSG